MQIQPIPSTLNASPIARDIQSGQGAALPLPGVGSDAAGIGATQGTPKSFGQMLADAIGEVNAAQNQAGDMSARFAAGEPMDVHQVMIAAQEASTSLNMAIQVRNKLVDAYQEVMRVNV
jgi:flagellar hook-basal body complex protein FliE